MKLNFMILKRDSFLKYASFPILTGLLVGTSYIPFPPWAVFFCFVPLWICWLEEKSARQVFWTGWLAQFVFTLIGFNWVAHTIHEFGHLPWIVSVIVLFLFCSFANLYVPLVGLAWFYFSRRLRLSPRGKIWALPLFMSIGERAFPMIFDWHLGYTWLWARFPAFHLADIVGFVGLSNIGLMFNCFFLLAWWQAHHKRIWWRAAAAPILLFLLLNICGYYHGQGPWPNDTKLNFLLVQANIGNQEKLMAEEGWAYRDNVINKFTALTQQGLNVSGHADFAVWPETAFPEVIDTPDLGQGYALKLKNFILSSKVKVITGGFSRLPGSGQITNSFFVLGDNGEWLAPPYHKTILLAFGEYMPFANWFPRLRTWFPEVGDFGRGPGPTVLNADGLKIGAQVCYEGLFDWFTRSQANQGAEILVNLTNDSWYGKWEQPFQHGFMTLARAIEVRRPLIRSTNTGISTVALASGEIMPLSPLHEPWFHLYEVPYGKLPGATIFMGWGYWLIPTLILLGLVFIAIRCRETK